MRRLAALLLLFGTACLGEGFTEFKQIDRLRVLAIGADKPWLLPTQTASISALVAQRRGDDAPLSYEWSWCPLSAGSDRGFECTVEQADLQAQIDEAVGPGVIEIPSFDLGTTATVTFDYSLPPIVFGQICEALGSQEVPSFITLPECNGTFPITIRLRVSTPEEALIAVKDLELVYDDAITEPNENPRIDAIRAAVPIDMDNPVDLVPNAPTLLSRTTRYKLTLSIDEDQAETYEEDGETVRENLVLTWFVDDEAGELDKTRTSFFDGEIEFSRLLTNDWVTPDDVNYPDANVRLFFVLRDERRGVSWTERRIMLRN